MLRGFIVSAAIALAASGAAADEITITNHTDDTIYKLYAWPQQMTAHTMNLLGFPLSPNSSEDIDVDNSYGDCIFTFETNPNDPLDKKKLFNPRKYIDLRDFDICKAKGQIELLPPDDGL